MRKNLDELAHLRQQEFIMECFKLIAEVHPGDITLNQIRIIQYIAFRSLQTGIGTMHKDICDALGLAPSTVTRAISGFVERGIITEQKDPEDGRKRFVLMNQSYPSRATLDTQLDELAKRFFRDT